MTLPQGPGGGGSFIPIGRSFPSSGKGAWKASSHLGPTVTVAGTPKSRLATALPARFVPGAQRPGRGERRIFYRGVAVGVSNSIRATA